MISFNEKTEIGPTTVSLLEMRKSNKVIGKARVRTMSISTKKDLYGLLLPLEAFETMKRFFYFSGTRKINKRFVILLEMIEIIPSERKKGYGKLFINHILSRFNKNDRLLLLEACPLIGSQYDTNSSFDEVKRKFKYEESKLKKLYESFGFSSISGTELMTLEKRQINRLPSLAHLCLIALLAISTKSFAIPHPYQKNIENYLEPMKGTDSVCKLVFSGPKSFTDVPVLTRLQMADYCISMEQRGEPTISLDQLNSLPQDK